MITTEKKEFICKKYDTHLKIINILNDKMMLQKHLIILAIELGIAKNKNDVLNVIKELEENQIIKRINFMGTSNKFIIFRKYAIRYLKGASSSQQVAAVPNYNSNMPYLENVYKVHIIIHNYLASLKDSNTKVNFTNLLDLLDLWNSTFLLNKNNALCFYEHNLFRLVNSKMILKKEFRNDIGVLRDEKKNRDINLDVKNRDFVKEYYKNNKQAKKKPKTKEELLEFSTIATLIRKNIQIHSIYLNKNILTINVMFFDLNNSQDCGRAIFNCALVYKLFKRIMEPTIKFKINFVTYTSRAGIDNMIRYLNTKRINQFTKEPTNKTYFLEMFSKYQINEIDLANINFTIDTLDIEKNYLDGIKKLNLINNK